MDKNDALSEISASEQNKYEKENIKYLNTQYKHLLEIAKLHEDDVEYALRNCMQISQVIYIQFLTFEEEKEFLDRIKVRPRMTRYYPMYAIMIYAVDTPIAQNFM